MPLNVTFDTPGVDPAEISPTIMRDVLARALWLAAAGLGIGLVASLALGQAPAKLVFEFSPSDAVVLGEASVLPLATAAAACYFPARRAARTDPSSVLRAD